MMLMYIYLFLDAAFDYWARGMPPGQARDSCRDYQQHEDGEQRWRSFKGDLAHGRHGIYRSTINILILLLFNSISKMASLKFFPSHKKR